MYTLLVPIILINSVTATELATGSLHQLKIIRHNKLMLVKRQKIWQGPADTLEMFIFITIFNKRKTNNKAIWFVFWWYIRIYSVVKEDLISTYRKTCLKLFLILISPRIWNNKIIIIFRPRPLNFMYIIILTPKYCTDYTHHCIAAVCLNVLTAA